MKTLFQTLFLTIIVMLMGFITLYGLWFSFLYILTIFTSKLFWIFLLIGLLLFIGLNYFKNET